MPRVYMRTPLAQRLAARSQAMPSGCVHFLGALRPDGYGELMAEEGRRLVLAHRAAWIVANGQIPDGLCVLHRCDNRQCVNVAHLFVGTRLDNNRDAVAKGRHHSQRKTHCRNGHPLSGDNLLIREVNGKPSRLCRACRNATHTRHNAKRRAS